MKNLFVLFFMIFSVLSFAGIRKGNGGNSVVCSDRAMLLDLYEGEILNDFHYDDISNDSWKNILGTKLQLISENLPEVGAVYSNWAITFETESRFLIGIDLGEINDSLHVAIPEGCSVRQTINQQLNPLPGEKRYWIDNKIWAKLNSFNKAAFVFHELVYRDRKDADSRRVREIVALVLSNEFSILSKEERKRLILDLY